jgi:hypothetical protein
MANLYGPRIVTDGLRYHLDAANRKSYPNSGSIWYDISGSTGSNFTLNGSLVHNNFYFDATNSSNYPSGPSYSHRTNNFTYSFWVMWDSIPSYSTLVENGYWVDSHIIRYATPSGGIQIYAEGVFYGAHSFTPVINTWYNIVIRRESNLSQFYLNGVYQNQLSFNPDINISNANLFLCRSVHTSSSQHLDGKISIFQMYTKALSANEVQQNYNALKGRFGL